MATRGQVYELGLVKKDGHVSVERRNSPQSGARLKQEPLTKSNDDSLTSTTRLRRLFNEAQLFAFSLTFMSTWVGMNT